MDGASILLMVAAFGVSFGWQPDKDDPRAYEVTAQIEPELLDVLKSGRSVPIEAHVPAEVTPIRKIRVVVGNETLARQTLAASDRVVRGQEPNPQPHTARLPEDNPWGDRYPSGTTPPPANSRQYDQRSATIGVQDIRTAQAPSPFDRARDAVTETGNAISTGASDFGRELDQQFRNLTGTTGTTGQSAPAAWPAPPPPPTTPVTSAPPSTVWTSIRPDLAPPRLQNPPLAPLARTDSTLRVASNPNGPSLSAATGGTRAPLHSVLTDPAASPGAPGPPSATTPPNWASGWGAASPPSQPTTPPAATATNPAEEARWAWPTPSPGEVASATGVPAITPTDNRYSQPAPAASTPAPSDLWAGFPPPPSTSPSTTPSDRYPTTPPAAAAPVQTSPASTVPAIGVAQPPATATVQTTPVGDQLPWIPLLAVSVALAGSLGANLFLGWSYADARFRYRNLVRKTTNSFHRAAGVAP